MAVQGSKAKDETFESVPLEHSGLQQALKILNYRHGGVKIWEGVGDIRNRHMAGPEVGIHERYFGGRRERLPRCTFRGASDVGRLELCCSSLSEMTQQSCCSAKARTDRQSDAHKSGGLCQTLSSNVARRRASRLHEAVKIMTVRLKTL